MGFGILFFGYFLTYAFSLSNVYFFADIIGAIVMLYAFSKLAEYNTSYKSAFAVCVGFTLVCGFNAVGMMLRLYPENGAVDIAVNGLKLALSCVMHIIMFLGARGISLGADSPKLAKNAERQIAATAVYYIAALFTLAFSHVLGESMRYVSVALLVIRIGVFIFNLVFIYRCFGTFYSAEDEDREPKKSRFGFINKMNEKIDSLETGTKKYGEDSIRLAIEESAKLDNDPPKKHKKKKK